MVAKGNFREPSVKACGVPIRTYYDWMRYARENPDPDSIFVKFSQALIAAENNAEIVHVERVDRASLMDADHSWKWLERKVPKRWSRDAKRLRDLEKMVAELLDDKRKREGGA